MTETLPGRRPPRPARDRRGLALTTDGATAEVFAQALEQLLALDAGGEARLGEALARDPGFALAHAVAATVAPTPAAARPHLHAARSTAGRATEREASFATAALLWCSPGLDGDAAMVAHVRRWPTDAWAVSLLTPSIASAGLGEGTVEVWPMLDEVAAAYPRGDWWLTGLRAFARTEQLRFAEAADLAAESLAAQPGSGHAAHARAHVLYETGRHGEGVAWLDAWLAGAGATQRFRGHFAWHAALSELAVGDTAAVARRYDDELAALDGVRAVVDSGSLLVRSAARGAALGDERVAAIDRAAGAAAWAPTSAFVAWNAALLAGLRADRLRLDGLSALAGQQARALPGDRSRAWSMVGRVCDAVAAALDGDPHRAAATLAALGPTEVLGGSPAQRELLADVARHCTAVAGGARTGAGPAPSRRPPA